MKSKKVIVLLLTASMVLSFTACARQAESDTQNENSTQEEQSEKSQETQQPVENQIEPNPPVIEQNTDSGSSEQQEKSQDPSEKEDHTNEEEFIEEESTEEEPTEEEPTEEELLSLFEKAMNEIISLATDPTVDVLRDIFDGDIECDYSNQITIDGISYQWTSRQYSEVVDYYSQTFTGEALDWLLDTSFADVDGVLYCFVGGGATGAHSKAVSIEKQKENVYQAHYKMISLGEIIYEGDTTFSIEKTDAGYRVSSIDYRPDLLDRE